MLKNKIERVRIKMVNQISLDVYLKYKPYYLRRESGLLYTHNGDNFTYKFHWNRSKLYPYITIFEHLHPTRHYCNNQEDRVDTLLEDVVRRRSIKTLMGLDGHSRSGRDKNVYDVAEQHFREFRSSLNGTYNVHLSAFTNDSCDESEVRSILRYMVVLSLILAIKHNGIIYDPKDHAVFDPKENGVRLSTLEDEINRILGN